MAPWPLNWLISPVSSASESSTDDASPTSSRTPPTAQPKQAQGGEDSPVTKHVKGSGGKTDPDSEAGVEAQTALASWAALLEPFKAGSGRLPEKARTDPSIRQRIEAPVAHLWEYVPFFAKQGTSLTRAFIEHHIYGPPKPSWGVELTLFTTFLRQVSSYSHLSSLARLRSMLELGSLLPAPKDGIVTPISFRVKKRNLRGILAGPDALEDGSRELTGEWVTNKRLWRRMTREWTVNGAAGSRSSSQPNGGEARSTSASKDGLVCLYLHGGAYYMFSAETHRYLTISVSRYCEARVVAVNYRLAPETRFPGQLHDAVSAYMRLTVDLKIPPQNIIFAGDSAGGGLCLATLLYLRDEGYPLPAGAILMSPWVDLTMSCESWETNRPYDYLPNPNAEDDHLHPVKCLLGDSIDEYLTHPYVSPLFGDLAGLPPLLIQAGDAEVLRDEITLLAHKAAMAGVKVEHEIFEDCVHVFQAFLFLEASRKAFLSQRTFVKHTLPRIRRKAAEAAAAASVTSTAATPDLDLDTDEMPSRASGGNATRADSFDFSEVDREVAADAHEVDQSGKAEEASLPPTPQSGDADLPPESELEDESLSDGDSGSNDSSTPSRGTPANGSPRVEPTTPTRSARELEDEPMTTPRLASQLTYDEAEPAATAPTARPRLRAYASARDLGMSSAIEVPAAASEPASKVSSPNNRRRSATVALPSSRSVGSSPRHSLVPLPSRSMGDQARRLHARTNSHPEIQALLASLIEAEEDAQMNKKLKTRIWGTDRSGQASPSPQYSGESDPFDEVVSQDG
ncbi:hypothetical protein JCM10908_005392 [Rhodotorula pacifica]|uniref:uncharacterized protein n=1 Tax=Rhodotorula pacifica TaxID=1495444 RepID=UPI003177A887